ncbi:type I-E CRISPR-associated endonuclease Cas1 [Thermobifida halotolerans]|uniref:CRISPR-associated endonuclease Cas1 n=1 Tax=Thermobifida halotolerans TaxID=483545 RepID=A0A399G6M5_9ACTN|nr:type I-E CRISPR-associated endonuclease Cas1e [Thermobifida halotolerans]UOE20831.1 type I-E CRISPR-associated endonuclease Cas1 [Thermobifida halotolerans]
MGADNARKALARPTLAMLPRVSDGLSFLSVDICRVVQTDTGVCAEIETDAGGVHRVPIPTASLACVLLGPGTSITSPASATFMRHNTTVVNCGAGGILNYGSFPAPNRTTKWIDRQARAYSDDERRLEIATRMYEMRFGEEPPPGTPVERLRQFEGARMKALYRSLAAKNRVKPFKRNYDPHDWDGQDPVNKALSAGNAALYGVVHSVLAHLGCHPALGFVHSGKQDSFVYDVADLYKAKTTIPLAFSLSRARNPEGEARSRLRRDLRLYRLIPQIVRDVQSLLAPDSPEEAGAEEEPTGSGGPWRVVDLWDPVAGAVAGGVNYADRAADGEES